MSNAVVKHLVELKETEDDSQRKYVIQKWNNKLNEARTTDCKWRGDVEGKCDDSNSLLVTNWRKPMPKPKQSLQFGTSNVRANERISLGRMCGGKIKGKKKCLRWNKLQKCYNYEYDGIKRIWTKSPYALINADG